MIEYKGYKTKELIGKHEADNWKSQLHTNGAIVKVLNQNKLHEEVEAILEQKKVAKAKEEGKDDENLKGVSSANEDPNLSDDEDGFGEIELVDDIPNVIKPLPERSMAQGMSFIKPLNDMVFDV